MGEQKMCAGSVWSGWQWVNCSAVGRYEEDGKHWCGNHAPSKVATREAKAKARRAAKFKEWEAKHNLRVATEKRAAERARAMQGVRVTDSSAAGQVLELWYATHHLLDRLADVAGDDDIENNDPSAKRAAAALAALEPIQEEPCQS